MSVLCFCGSLAKLQAHRLKYSTRSPVSKRVTLHGGRTLNLSPEKDIPHPLFLCEWGTCREHWANSHQSSPFRLVGWVSLCVFPTPVRLIPNGVYMAVYQKNRGTSSLFSQVGGTPVGRIDRPQVFLERQCQRVRKLQPTASYETRTYPPTPVFRWGSAPKKEGLFAIVSICL